MTNPVLTTDLAPGSFGPAVGLACRECGQRYETSARYAAVARDA